MQITATVRTLTEGAPGQYAGRLALHVITARADDYDAARAELDQRVPVGGQIMSVRTH